jgi:hypothetical protein
MKPVDQTRCNCGDSLTEAPGNCWAACIASILEIPLSELPDEADYWTPGQPQSKSYIPYEKATFAWLLQRGLILVEVKMPDVYFRGDEWEPYCILAGPSPRNPLVSHAVVGRGAKIVHDPHPSRDGLLTVDGEPWWYEFLVPVDVAQMAAMRPIELSQESER